MTERPRRLDAAEIQSYSRSTRPPTLQPWIARTFIMSRRGHVGPPNTRWNGWPSFGWQVRTHRRARRRLQKSWSRRGPGVAVTHRSSPGPQAPRGALRALAREIAMRSG